MLGSRSSADPSHSQWGHYWGGDLEGIIARADYLRDLGITAVWLSPLFEQVDDIEHGYGPMHGYWTKDFKRVNPHFVRLGEATSLHSCETLRRMIDTLHERGLKIVLDIVCNHSSPELNGSKGVVTDDGAPLANFHDDHNQFYHHYPPITDWEDEFQLLRHEMLGLATFNEGNIDFRNYIKSAIMAWLDLGFDALRIDTLKHMPVWFWQEFVTDIQAHHPARSSLANTASAPPGIHAVCAMPTTPVSPPSTSASAARSARPSAGRNRGAFIASRPCWRWIRSTAAPLNW